MHEDEEDLVLDDWEDDIPTEQHTYTELELHLSARVEEKTS